MQLRRLEIFGFKSFKNKTVLEFDNDGITGIVGPNGCGKSNIVDAFLWVMGETAPKHLRSSSLADVIFSGTHQEPPSPMAEVSLTLSKGDGEFPDKYKSFSEIMITRRSFREGKTEYFINQQACLLRDIKEVFMDTGAGCRGFSIIEQEAIEKLITAKPQERRFIIEEVAGITKFKTRKHESKRKLELVKQNLKRLEDVIKTQEKQLNSLNQQAKRAEKYRQLKEDIKTREMEVLCRVYNELNDEQEKLKQDLQNQKEEKQKLETSIKEWESGLESIEKNITDGEVNLEKDKEYLTKLNYKVIDRQKEIEKMTETIDVYNKNMEAINENKAKLIKEETKFVEQELEARKELAKLDSSLLENYDSQLVSQSLEKIKLELNAVQENKAQKESQLDVTNKQIQFIEREQNKISEEKKRYQDQLNKVLKNKDKLTATLEKNKQMKFSVGQSLSDLEKNAEILEERNKTLSKEVESLNQEVSLLKYKTEETQKLIQKFESLNEGSHFLSTSNPSTFKPLFKNLKIEPEFEQALVSVLGTHVQALVPSNNKSIEEGIKKLKEQRKGKSSFLSSLPTETIKRPSKKELEKYPAFICYLEEKIDFNLDTNSLKAIINNTVVVNSLQSAFQMKQTFPALQFVTKDGDLLTKESIVYAGSDSSKKESNLFQLKNQIESNSVSIKTKEMDLKLKQSQLEEQTSQLKKMKKEILSLKDQKVENSESVIIQQKDIEQLENESRRLSDYETTYQEKWFSFENEKTSLLDNKKSLEADYNKDKQNFENKQSELNKLVEANNKYQNVKMEILQNSKEQAGIEQKINLLTNLVMQSSTAATTKENGLKLDVPQIIDKEKQKVQDIQKELDLLTEETSQLESKIATQNKSKEENKKSQGEITDNLKTSKERLMQINLNENSYQSDQEKIDIKKQNINEKLINDYHFKVEEQEYTPQYEDISIEKLNKDLEGFKERLEKTSTVNLLAITEFEEISKDHEFLLQQREDLINSKKDLLKVISHIDKICEKRFIDMLEEINMRFSKIFPLVFEGDNAEARLVLHQDLESAEDPGLDIIVRPPGKKVQSVTLLSRGEKALTSICLIYALFLVKPSPFCIVDEIDSPLDDANVFRLISVLNEMSRKSQIVTITHNKYTMKSCKKLYGVTMEKLGVSQLVSVDMAEDNSKLFSEIEKSL